MFYLLDFFFWILFLDFRIVYSDFLMSSYGFVHCSFWSSGVKFLDFWISGFSFISSVELLVLDFCFLFVILWFLNVCFWFSGFRISNPWMLISGFLYSSFCWLAVWLCLDIDFYFLFCIPFGFWIFGFLSYGPCVYLIFLVFFWFLFLDCWIFYLDCWMCICVVLFLSTLWIFIFGLLLFYFDCWSFISICLEFLFRVWDFSIMGCWTFSFDVRKSACCRFAVAFLKTTAKRQLHGPTWLGKLHPLGRALAAALLCNYTRRDIN